MGLPDDKENFQPNSRLFETTTPNADEESVLNVRSEGTVNDSDPQEKGNSSCFREDENCSFLNDGSSQTTNLEKLDVRLEVHHVKKFIHYDARKINKYSGDRCCIRGCSVTKFNGEANLHFLPKQKTLLYKWLHNTRVKYDDKFPWRYRICDYHFEQQCFNGSRLLRGVVPTLRLGSNRRLKMYQNNFFQEEAPTTNYSGGSQLTQFSSEQCCIGGCGATTRDGKLHKFPKAKELLCKWMHNTQVTVDSKFYWRYRICDSHFERECFNSYRLQRGKVPTLRLGPNRPLNIFQNDQAEPAQNRNGQHKLQKNVVHNEVKFGYEKCSLIHCQKEKSQHGVLLFKFPKSKPMQEQWMYNLRIQYDEQQPFLICNEHFETRCMEKQNLKEWAVPTLQLGENVPKILLQNKVKKRVIKTCCLQYCKKQRDENTKLFRLPNNPGMIQNWARATGMPFTMSQRNTRLICSRHFDPKLIGKRRLRTNAVPTLNLGYIQNALAYHNEISTSPPKCFISNCMSDFNVHLYKFPDKYILLRQWCRSLKLSDVVGFRGKYICANHLPVKPENCAVCGTIDLQLPLLIFPGNRIVRQKWCHNLKIDNISNWNFSRHLCSKHFEDRCFSAADKERTLLKDAVPTLHLRHMDVNIFHND